MPEPPPTAQAAAVSQSDVILLLLSDAAAIRGALLDEASSRAALKVRVYLLQSLRRLGDW